MGQVVDPYIAKEFLHEGWIFIFPIKSE